MKRDRMMIERILSLGAMSTRQVQKQFFPNIALATVLRRLRTLKTAGYLTRVRGTEEGGLLWVATEKSAKKMGIEHFMSKVNKNSVPHLLALSDVRISLEDAGAVRGWKPEHELKQEAGVDAKKNSEHYSPSKILVPDALTVMENKDGSYITLAIELELHLKSRSRYKQILSTYANNDAIQMFWYIVPNEKIGKVIQEEWVKASSSYQEPKFMWSLLSEVLNAPKFAQLHRINGTRLLKDQFILQPKQSDNEAAHPAAHSMSSL